ncbi:ABC transporter permease [Isosphaeraceae bacterium EP7]
MRHVFTLCSRELAAYFLTPTAYLVLLAFQAVAWLNFWDLVDVLARPQRTLSVAQSPINAYLSGSMPFWFAVVFAVPVLTMRLLAEERRSGTIETLLTAPVTEAQVVMAKWLAGLAMFVALLVPFWLYLPFLYFQADYRFDLGPPLALGLGMLTLGMMFTAIGLFYSALTRQQVLAAIATFVTLFLLLFVTFIGERTAVERGSPWSAVARYCSPIGQALTLGVGQLDLRFLALHVSVCVLFLYLTVQVLRSRETAG